MHYLIMVENKRIVVYHHPSCFFFNDTATTEIYTFPYTTLFRSEEADLGVAEAEEQCHGELPPGVADGDERGPAAAEQDRKSTRLNSSHSQISYAVFCLKKKKKNNKTQ